MASRVLLALGSIATLALAADLGGRAFVGRGLARWASAPPVERPSVEAPLPAPTPEPGSAEDAIALSCENGRVTAAVAGAWHANAVAPWKWDEGTRVSLDEHGATFQGSACRGTVKAFVCTDDVCRGPLALRVD